ncbi:hypothetical protein BKA62DRAFT_826957 [Auriculariales sp. MPI-PUGE-AT-0066]|nr:hypothetical protein BKA62DRAFT_826957 [Auriculariales sp. MPI-PUGE-AT-0066]
MLSLWHKSEEAASQRAAIAASPRKISQLDDTEENPRSAKRARRDQPERAAAVTKFKPVTDRQRAQLIGQIELCDMLASFDDWHGELRLATVWLSVTIFAEFSTFLTAVVLRFTEAERDFGLRLALPGRRCSLLVLEDAADHASHIAALSEASALNIAFVHESITSHDWTRHVLSHDLLVLHAAALVALLERGVAFPQHFSLIALEVGQDGETFRHLSNVLRTTASQVSLLPRLFVARLQKRSADPYQEALQNDSLAKLFKCSIWEEEHHCQHPRIELVQLPNGLKHLPTRLTREILVRDGDHILSSYYVMAEEVLQTLGPCAADLFWKAQQPEIHALVGSQHGEGSMARDLASFIQDYLAPVPLLDGPDMNVTPKLLELVHRMKARHEVNTQGPVVFARNYSIASALNSVFIALAVNQVKVVVLSDLLEVEGSFSMGICLGLPDDALSYAKCLSLVSNGGSLMLLISDAAAERRTAVAYAHLAERMANWLPYFKTVESAIAPTALYHPSVMSQTSGTRRRDDATEDIVDPSTGSSISVESAGDVIHRTVARYAMQQVHSREFPPLFEYAGSGDCTTCTIALPPNAPLRTFTGPPRPSITAARQSACFALCRLLRELGQLDPRDLPRTTVAQAYRSPMPCDGRPDLNMAFHRYPRQCVVFWDYTLSRHMLYAAVLRIDRNGYKPMLFLTRAPLPTIPTFRLFFEGTPATIDILNDTSPMTVSEEQLEMLHVYTLRILRGMANKSFSASAASMSYFVAPLPEGDGQLSVDRIPWETELRPATLGWVTAVPDSIGSLSDEALQDIVVQDRWGEFTRRFYVIGLRRDLSPLSRPPPDALGVQYESFKEQYEAHLKDKASSSGLKDEHQPMFEVDRLPGLINRLVPAVRSMPPEVAPPKFLIPEVCAKFVVSARTFKTAQLLPSLVRCVEDVFMTKMLNHAFFNNEISELHLLTAISCPSLCGENNYDRLELLGDAVLKWLSSCALLVRYPDLTEGQLHTERQKIISNATLTKAACESGLPAFILSRPLSVKSWLPPGSEFEQPRPKPLSAEDASDPTKLAAYQNSIQRQEKGDAMARARRLQDSSEHVLGDKVIADVTEAIIGAAFLSGGKNLVLRVASRLSVPLEDYITANSSNGIQSFHIAASTSASLHLDTSQILNALVGREIKHPRIVAQAFNYPGPSIAKGNTYQRLEFVGDAILDMLVVRRLWQHEQLDQEALTLLKAAMVENRTLAALCVRTGLHDHIVQHVPSVRDRVQTYCHALQLAHDAEHALAQSEDRAPAQYWLELDFPKLLSDVVEAVIGALFISENCDLGAVEAFFEAVMVPFYDEYIRLDTLSPHPTSILLKIIEASSCQSFDIKKTILGPSHHRNDVFVHGLLLGTATASTVATAARKACIAALDTLQRDKGFLRRACDCKATQLQARQMKNVEKSKASKSRKGGKKAATGQPSQL